MMRIKEINSMVYSSLVSLVEMPCLPSPQGRRAGDEGCTCQSPLTLNPSPRGEGYGALGRKLYEGISSKAVFALIVLCMLNLNISAQQPMNLPQIIREIELNNSSLKAFDYQAKSQDAKVEGAGAWMAPMVGAGTFMSPYPGQGMIGEGDKGAFMISAEQDIPNPAKVKAKRQYLETLAETYTLGKFERFNELRSQARQLYFDLIIAAKKRHFQSENKRIMQTMKKLADIRYPYNQGRLNEVFKAEGRLAEADVMLLMTEGQIRSNKIALNALMNRPATAVLEIDTAYKASFTPLAGLDSTYLVDTRSDLRHMQHNIHSMKANINQMRQQAKPDFRIRFDHMSNYSAMMPKQFTIMGMLSVPIVPWSSKMYKSEIKSMNLEIDAMRAQKEGMLTEMLAMARSMTVELTAMEQQLKGYEDKILPALKKGLEVSMLSYQENKMDLSMVIDSWEAINMTQMNYLDALQRYYKMIAEYEKSIER
ncbi:TolC family protein [Pedobacter sp. P351]|uniref:TolC family protein n=1 Tax=Pedobacter superstes TaxID=3133441 RepID=UPI0030A30238